MSRMVEVNEAASGAVTICSMEGLASMIERKVISASGCLEHPLFTQKSALFTFCQTAARLFLSTLSSVSRFVWIPDYLLVYAMIHSSSRAILRAMATHYGCRHTGHSHMRRHVF